MRQPIRSGRQPTGSNSACSASHSRVSGSGSRAASGRGEEAARSRSQAKLCNQSRVRSEEHTSELQSLMRISYAVLCLKKKTEDTTPHNAESDQHYRTST